MSEIPAGAIRFNSDSHKLEYWNGSTWFQIHTATPDIANTGDRLPGPRGIIAGGRVSAPAFTDLIEYVNISSMGNALDFGDLTAAASEGSGCSDSHGGLG